MYSVTEYESTLQRTRKNVWFLRDKLYLDTTQCSHTVNNHSKSVGTVLNYHLKTLNKLAAIYTEIQMYCFTLFRNSCKIK